MSKLDFNTYGNSEASKTLVKILNGYDDRKLNRNIGNIWGDYCTGLEQLKEIKDLAYKEKFVILWLKTFERLIVGKKYPVEVRNFFTNIIVAKFREFKIKEIDF